MYVDPGKHLFSSKKLQTQNFVSGNFFFVFYSTFVLVEWSWQNPSVY